MIIGFWSGGKFSHASLFVCYFSEVKEYGLVGRVFCIELFIKSDTNQIVLSIKGPVYNTRDYDCKQFYIVHANMNEIIDIAKQQINEHGEYGYWTNNCRTFASNCLQKIKTKFNGMSAGITAEKMNKYIRNYVSKKVSANTLGGVGGVVGAVTTAMPVSILFGAITTAPIKATKAQENAGQSISFIKVLRKYPLD